MEGRSLHNQQILSSPDRKNPFKSFWMAGYECSDKINAFGERVDLLKITSHLHCIDEDYQNLKLFNMKTVREGIRWGFVETKPYQYDWTDVLKMIEAGERNNIQQVWDICHFGFPDDITPLHPMFPRRFAAMCRAFVKFFRIHRPSAELIITPINEVSFLSWLGGDVRGTSPFCVGQGWEVKYRLMKAYIEGIEAMLSEDPTIRIFTTEPIINIVEPINASVQEREEAKRRNDEQFQVTDILCGAMCPELRGKPEYLDILGYNYYYNNQWVNTTHEFLDWRQQRADERFIPLHLLLSNAANRYKRPVVISETSHPKEDRPYWVKMIGDECLAALKSGIPLWGVCWYPVVDRPDWDNLSIWHDAGIWDGNKRGANEPRTMHIPTAGYLLRIQDALVRVSGSK